MSNVGSHGTCAFLGASAASLGASTPGRPGRDDTVNGASSGIAGAGLLKGQAGNTAVSGRSVDTAGTALGAGAAGLGAGGPIPPLGQNAVNGAGRGVATFSCCQSGAGDATMVSSSDNNTGACG
jgi:hypothetical protein